jgi:tetratricopeptide (TPR) repeat protein
MPPKKQQKQPKQQKQEKPQHSVEALLERARSALDTCEPDLARKFLLKALEAAPNNVQILEALGVVEMEAAAAVTAAAAEGMGFGDDDSAMNGAMSKCEELTLQAESYFRKAVELDANAVGSAAFMYLGQMATDKEAIQFYDLGIERLKVELQSFSEDNDEVSSL